MLDRAALARLTAVHPAPRAARDADRQSAYGTPGGGLGVLNVYGAITKRGTGDEWIDNLFGIASVERLEDGFDELMANAALDTIAIRVESPGGETYGVFDFAERIFQARGQGKKLIAVVDEYAYSAGYLIAAAADEIVMPKRAGGVGSIGVYAVRIDASKIDGEPEWIIVEHGTRKADGHPFKAASDEELADLRAEVDRLGNLFDETVARYRGLSVEAVRAMEARGFHGQAALTAGLINSFGTWRQTTNALATRTKRAAQPGGRSMSKQDEAPGGADEHVEKSAQLRLVGDAEARGREAGKAEAAVLTEQALAANTARIATIKNMCVAAGKPGMVADFADPTCSIEHVAEKLAATKVAEAADEQINGANAPGAKAAEAKQLDSLAGLDTEAIMAEHRALASAPRFQGRV